MSSLKSFVFTNNTKEEIIQKYEEVLLSRETQIEDLTIELGRVQLKNESLEEINFNLNKEIERLKEVVLKKDKIIGEELTSKEYIFMRLQDKEKEVDLLNEKLNKSNKNKGYDALSQASSKLTSFAGYLFGGKKENSRKGSDTYNNQINSNSNTNNSLNTEIIKEEKQVNYLHMTDKNEDSQEEVDENKEKSENLNKIQNKLEEKKEKETINEEDNPQKNIDNEIRAVDNVQSKSLSRINEIKNKKKKKKETTSEQVETNQ